jgi:protein-S-isoprenylcysteine O-methyltransferase Ste14
MFLQKRLSTLGDFLFKQRSYIPLILVIFIFLESRRFHYVLGDHRLDLVFGLLCLAVGLSGFLVRVITTGFARSGTSGRNTKGQWAQSLNTDGTYSVVRNPLYLGNIVIILGLSLLSQSYLIVIINVLLAICFYIPIIMREEEFLDQSFKKEFENYLQRTPAFIPNLRLWKKPALKFNLLRVFYREHDTFMGIIFGFFAIQMSRQAVIHKKFYFDKVWATIFIAALLTWVVLKSLKRHFKSIDKGE